MSREDIALERALPCYCKAGKSELKFIYEGMPGSMTDHVYCTNCHTKGRGAWGLNDAVNFWNQEKGRGGEHDPYLLALKDIEKCLQDAVDNSSYDGVAPWHWDNDLRAYLTILRERRLGN